MGPRPHLSYCPCKTAWLGSELLVSMGSSPDLWFLHAKQWHLDQTYKSLRVPDLTCRFVHAIQRNYHQNYCIYGSHPLSVVFAFKTATFGAELQDSICPRPHLSLCACNTAWLVSQWLVSFSVPALICGFHIQNRALSTWITSLYGSQTSPVVVYIQNSVICTRMTSLYWFQPSSVVLCIQNSNFRTRFTSLYGSQTSSAVLSSHNSVLSTRTKSLYWFQTSPH